MIEYLERRIEGTPDSAWLRASLGHVLLAEGRVDAAIASYRRALALAPESAELRESLDAALRRQRGENAPGQAK